MLPPTLLRRLKRAFTTIALLNDDFGEGGATAFPNLGIEVKVAAGDLIVWQNLERHLPPGATLASVQARRESGEGPRPKALYSCNHLSQHASTHVDPADAHAAFEAGKRRKAAARLAGYAVDEASLEGGGSGVEEEEEEGEEEGEASWVGKLAWQRWYSLHHSGFVGERVPWTQRLGRRHALQPIMSCDPVGAETFRSDMKRSAGKKEGEEPTVSCRVYSHCPFPKDELMKDFGFDVPGPPTNRYGERVQERRGSDKAPKARRAR